MFALIPLMVWHAAAVPLTVEAQHADLDLAQSALVEGHPGLYWYIGPEELERAFEEAREDVRPGASSLDFYRLLAPVVGKVRCGHTGVLPTSSDLERALEGPHSPPLRVSVVEGRPFVVESLEPGQVPAGAELLSINGRDAKTVVVQLMAGWSFGGDGPNDGGRRRSAERGFGGHYALLVELADQFDLTYAVDDQIISATLEPVPWTSMVQPPEEPLALHIEGDRAVLRIASLERPRIEAAGLEFDGFVRRSLRQVGRASVQRLVVDLRDNGGGNTGYGFELMGWLANEPFVYLDHQEATARTWSFLPHTDKRGDFALPGRLVETTARADRYEHGYHAVRTEPRHPRRKAYDGELRVLVNGGTFSAASELGSALQRQGATVYGEESGGGAVAYTGVEFVQVELPHSGVRLRLPLVAQITTAEGEPGRGVVPDVAVRPTIQDLVEGRDPVLEAALTAP